MLIYVVDYEYLIEDVMLLLFFFFFFDKCVSGI